VTSGYHLAFLIGAGLITAGIAVAAVLPGPPLETAPAVVRDEEIGYVEEDAA
jgi:hypothetical protein